MSILLFFTGGAFEEGLVTVVSTVVVDKYREEPVATVVSIGISEEVQTYTPEEEGIVAVVSVSGEDHPVEIRQVTAVALTIGEDGGAQTEWLENVVICVVRCDEYLEERLLAQVVALVFSQTEVYEERLVTAASETIGEDYFYEERSLTIESATTGADYFYEERLVEIASETTGWDLAGVAFEQPTLTIVAVTIGEDGIIPAPEQPIVYVMSEGYAVDLWNQYSERLITVASDTLPEDNQNYFNESQFVAVGIIKSSLMDAVAPKVKGMSPRPGESAVSRNKKVSFYVVAGGLGGDGVDISTVKVTINGVEYGAGDPEFSYSGSPAQYYVEVGHPNWNYEQAVAVEINAISICGMAMIPVMYSFTAEWQDSLTRTGVGNIELYKAGDYSFDILTVEEDWVRQGVVRYTAELEVWWGRYQKLPYIENMEMMANAGNTNAQGKEILDNGWLSVKVSDGDFVPMHASTKIDFGPMFTHSKKSLFFKLLVPESAATKKYFVLGLRFEPQMFFPYGRFQYAKGIYSSAGNMIALMPNAHIYRAYVFDAAMWNELVALGIVTSPFWRGEDHQW